MHTDNGVLELWSNGGTRNTAFESLNNDSRHLGGGEAVEKAALEGDWRRVGAENGCAQLYAFTAFYHLFLTVTLRAPKFEEGGQELPGLA